MLTLILGIAGSGKTSYVFERMAEAVARREAGNILIVPEQYSHDAERTLSRLCGDSTSLYAEVLSFSRLASRVFAETGGMAERFLDKGGILLAMSLALSRVSPELSVYNVGHRRPEFLGNLAEAYDELRSSGASVLSVARAAETASGILKNKLSDLALIFTAYETVKEVSGRDPGDRLDKLAENIGFSTIGNEGRIYIDGFTDFTAQEMRTVRELMRKEADITVCLTCRGFDDDESAFCHASETARKLAAVAKELGAELSVIKPGGEEKEEMSDLDFIKKHLFDYNSGVYSGESDNVELVAAKGVYDECAFAAHKVVELAKKGYRFRDISVVSPDFERYRSALRGVFLKYGISMNIAEKSNILQKAMISFIMSALDIINNNWAYSDVFRYIKTGFADVDMTHRDMLENYVLKWNIRGSKAWTAEQAWKMHPEGYSEEMSEADEEKLAMINSARTTVARPLEKLQSRLRDADSVTGMVRALYMFMEDTGLYGKISARAEAFEREGKLQLAEEYNQLWDILVAALEQFADITGESTTELDETIRLLKLVLSQYEVSTIPASADAVNAGDMRRTRKRGTKCLIIIGAVDDAMPSASQRTGIFSDDERERLRLAGIELPDAGDDSVIREMNAVYAAFSLPSDKLVVSYPSEGGKRCSFMMTRLGKLLGRNITTTNDEIYTAAPLPCFELAVTADSNDYAARVEQSLRKSEEWAEKLEKLKKAADTPRGRLTAVAAEKLYGRNINISASRIDKYYSCKYSYFLQYGLKLKPRKEATLDAPETGTYMHFVLENVAREAENAGGFREISDERLEELTRRYTHQYAEKKLGGLEGKTGRFKYLFARLADDAVRVVKCMAEELRFSDFKPVEFELKFAANGDLPPREIEVDGGLVKINGLVDRADGWIKGDELYLRVVDYKTGRKAFSLSDIWYGMGLQMLLYLFTLESGGGERYGKKIVPAGVLYAPTRDLLVQAAHDMTDEEIEKERVKNMKRSGLLLDDADVLDAMEHDRANTCLPIRFTKDGAPTGENLATLEQLGALSRKIDEHLVKMGREIKKGTISADPYFKSQMDNACVYCDYFEACHFFDGNGQENKDSYRRLRKLKTAEAWEKMMGVDG